LHFIFDALTVRQMACPQPMIFVFAAVTVRQMACPTTDDF
jgi:hypothetical protein